MCGERMPFFPTLRDWIVGFLEAENVLQPSKDKLPTNLLLVSILKLVQSLVLFGYFTNLDDIANLLKPLLHLLDGKTDKPQEKVDEHDLKSWRKSNRFHHSPSNKPVFAVKLEALTVVDLLFNYKLSSLLNHFMLDFKRLLPEAEKHKANPILLRGHHHSLSPDLHALVPFLNNEDPIPVHLVDNYFRSLKQSVEFLDPHGHLIDICLDLARYEDFSLVTLSLQIVNRHFSQIKDLFDKGTLARVLTVEESVNNFKRVMEMLPVLRRLALIKLEDSHLKEMTA